MVYSAIFKVKEEVERKIKLSHTLDEVQDAYDYLIMEVSYHCGTLKSSCEKAPNLIPMYEAWIKRSEQLRDYTLTSVRGPLIYIKEAVLKHIASVMVSYKDKK